MVRLRCRGRFVVGLVFAPAIPLDAEIEAGSIILTPVKKRLHKGRIINDPVTGLPVLSAGADAPVLSSKEVEAILANFP
jgi:hypothetical protein